MKNKEIVNAFGARLRQLREQKALSQQELANEADIDKKTIQRIENARLNPSLDTLVSLSKGLQISLSELCKF